MKRSSRVIWLPALAVLVPCAFIAALGYLWVRLEREAARYRGAEAAQHAVDRLRHDLEAALRASAESVARASSLRDASGGPFQLPPACPDLCLEAFVFDASRTLDLDYEAALTRSVETYRQALDTPTRAVFAEVDALERRGDSTRALTAVHTLLVRGLDPRLRAPALLAAARLSGKTGQAEDADRHAKAIQDCCADARDEFGVSFVLYAAWARARLYREAYDPNGQRLAALANELRTLLQRGFLGAGPDLTTVSLLAQRFKHHPGFADLAIEIDRVHARVAARIVMARLVTAWVGQTEPAALGMRVRFQPVAPGPSTLPAALVSVADGRSVVMTLARDRLNSWVRTWATTSAAFDVVLEPQASDAPSADLRAPLFHELPELRLTIRQRPSDPTAGRREQLFLVGISLMIVLTLVVAALSVRDVLRDRRTAALRSAFIASVTHEIKTPLTSIRLLTDTLRLGRARPEAKADILETIAAESDRLSRLVDNVLTSSRIESGTHQYRPQVVSLADAVRDALRRFGFVLRTEGFELFEEIAEQPTPVKADPDALGQAVLNLVGNAVKYSGQSRRVAVSVVRLNGQATLTVADEGIGIAPADQAAVFEPFYRTAEAAAHTGGAGLGLSLVRHFAVTHGGSIAVRSRPGAGSAFSLSLPIASEWT